MFAGNSAIVPLRETALQSLLDRFAASCELFSLVISNMKLLQCTG